LRTFTRPDPGLVFFAAEKEMDEIIFLTWEEVEILHRRQLELFGGLDGFIDRGVVESAIAQPKQTMFGEYLHDDIAHMAAAYLFHLATTQGFMDGNKRIALACALTFLERNGFEVMADEVELYDLAMSVANNRVGKAELADWFRERIEPLEA
jgi:death-on-curing protein